LGVREDWANKYPNSHVAVVKALLEACQYCENPAHWEELRDLLSDRRYLSCPKEYIQFSQSNACDLNKSTDVPHHLFFGAGVNRPSRTEHLWMMTQLARWGDIPFPRNWVEILERVCRVGVFSTAARELGLSEVVSYQRSTPVELFDGVPFNAEDPIAYLNSLPIHRDFSVAEIALDQPRPVVAA
jgi:bicarbonate transport system ATP-binding protein